METYILDIYLDDANKEYLNKLTFMTLFKSRSLGYHCAADLFSDAYRYYNDSVTTEVLHALETVLCSKYIISTFNIEYKNDLIYLIRHPKLFTYDLDAGQKSVRKKVLQFFDLDDPANAYKRNAYDYLSRFRPRKRAAVIDRILEQYLILQQNEYYISQSSHRMMNCLINNSQFDEEGNILGHGKSVVDTIWLIGSQQK